MASSPFSMAAFRRFAELARRADLIHYHFPWPFMDVVQFRDAFGQTFAGSPITPTSRVRNSCCKAYKPLQKRFLRDVDRIVATSPNYLETSPVLRQYKDKVEVIPIGLDEHRYPRPDPARVAYWREQVGPKFFLFVGNLRYYKGSARAAGRPGRHLDESGDHRRRPGRRRAERRRRRGLSLGAANLRFVGGVCRTRTRLALLSLCYGLVFPSHLRSEAFGISLVEGAMFGKPLISTEIGTGTSFVNLADTTGLVVPPSDPAAFRGAMQKLWDAPELASRLGQQARQRFEQHLTSEQMVGRYVDLYQRLVGKARS